MGHLSWSSPSDVHDVHRNSFAGILNVRVQYIYIYIVVSLVAVYETNGRGCYYNNNLCGRSFRIFRHRCGCRGRVTFFFVCNRSLCRRTNSRPNLHVPTHNNAFNNNIIYVLHYIPPDPM